MSEWFWDTFTVILEVDSLESGFERDFRRESQKWDFIGFSKLISKNRWRILGFFYSNIRSR